MRFVSLSLVAVVIAGCAGTNGYVAPDIKVEAISNTKLIEKSREDVWNAGIAALGKRFFVINNLDKSSGLININYSGDPEKYVDCGRITSRYEIWTLG
jgi:hypothetical protein